MNLIQEQARRNAEADAGWELYASHRERVTRMLLDARTAKGRGLCLLGAGNLNDVDLEALASEFQEIVLVDIDAAAIRRGLSRQGISESAKIRMLPPTDVSGVFGELATITLGARASDNDIDRCVQKVTQDVDLGEPVECDVVASVGLLTQLIDGVICSIGESHPRSWEIVSAIRRQHLRLLLHLTAPCGTSVLVTEVVSSESCPALLSTRQGELAGLLQREIAARNFFTGTNPAALQQLLRTDPCFAEGWTSTRFTDPWLWSYLSRTYAVYGVALQKRGACHE